MRIISSPKSRHIPRIEADGRPSIGNAGDSRSRIEITSEKRRFVILMDHEEITRIFIMQTRGSDLASRLSSDERRQWIGLSKKALAI